MNRLAQRALEEHELKKAEYQRLAEENHKKELAAHMATQSRHQQAHQQRQTILSAYKKVPWDLKAIWWCKMIFSQPRALTQIMMRIGVKVRAKIVQALQFVENMRHFLAALFGGFVTKDEYVQRQATCHTCEFILLGRKGNYCNACGCGKWLMSRLNYKNKLRKHYCPRRKHGGVYPDWWKPEFAQRKPEYNDSVEVNLPLSSMQHLTNSNARK